MVLEKFPQKMLTNQRKTRVLTPLVLTLTNTNMNLVGFCGADWAGNADDRKSDNGGCSILETPISWHSKKQNSILLSIVEVEYITAGSYCTQLLWMKQMLED